MESTNPKDLKASCWSITINNPTDDDFRQWECLKTLHWVKNVCGQLEKGEQEATPHLQGMIKSQHVRFSQVKKALPRAHIEVARSESALVKYVAKSETRVGEVPVARVATQADVQKRLLLVIECQAGLRYENWDSSVSITDMLYKFSYEIRKDWEYWVDTAVRQLILAGYYGVEFVMSNPQIRTAFRKYIVEILAREAASQN